MVLGTSLTIEYRHHKRNAQEPVLFRECYNGYVLCILQNKLKEHEDSEMPPYFRFLTLLGFRIFQVAQVEAVVLEVGLGGRLDATNVVPAPKVCGITALGYVDARHGPSYSSLTSASECCCGRMDHVEILGNSLYLIGKEKAGIFKTGVPAFTIPQKPEGMQALEEVAAAKKVQLCEVQPLAISNQNAAGCPYRQGLPGQIGIGGEHQLLNAGLAVELCREWARRCIASGEMPQYVKPHTRVKICS